MFSIVWSLETEELLTNRNFCGGIAICPDPLGDIATYMNHPSVNFCVVPRIRVARNVLAISQRHPGSYVFVFRAVE